MRTLTIGIALGITLGLTSAAAHAQTWKPPADAQRCPSKWGAGDERGSGNHMKPADGAAGRAADQDRRGRSRWLTC